MIVLLIDLQVGPIIMCRNQKVILFVFTVIDIGLDDFHIKFQ